MARKLSSKLPANRRPSKHAKDEAARARVLGAAAAHDIADRRGCAFARHGADQLLAQARRRGADTFDKAYARAYAAVANACKR